jgi:SNF2 family DNA or RNA helicase
MGLGKTIQTIAAIRLLNARSAIRSSLIVAPAGLVRQWRRQLRDWAPELKVSTIVGSAGERAAAWAARAQVHIASYEALRSDLSMRAPHGPGQRHWDVVAIDEAQRIKNATSSLAITVKALMTVDSGAKSLVFSQFVEEPFGARRLARELAAWSPFLLVGDIDPTTRANRAVVFERDPQRQIMVMSLRAGGVGLNLTSASHVFHFDRWWNPAVEAQAEDRTYRIGQRRPVHVYAYLCSDTIEERIEEILLAKRALFADVIDGVDMAALRRLDLDVLLGAIKGKAATYSSP